MRPEAALSSKDLDNGDWVPARRQQLARVKKAQEMHLKAQGLYIHTQLRCLQHFSLSLPHRGGKEHDK